MNENCQMNIISKQLPVAPVNEFGASVKPSLNVCYGFCFIW